MAGRIYGIAGVGGIRLNLFSDRDVSSLDDESRQVYRKASRNPNKVEKAIIAALKEGKSVMSNGLRRLVTRHYGKDVLHYFAYAQKKATGKRRSGDSAMLHAHATQARVARAFGPKLQQLAVTHDSIEDNSETIVEIEYHFLEQAGREWAFLPDQTDSLRLLTNIYRMLISDARETAASRDKGYVREILSSMPVPRSGNIKKHISGWIAERRKRMRPTQKLVEEPHLRDLETIVALVDTKGMPNRDAVQMIGNETARYASQKLYARALKREIENQRDFIDQSVERLLLQRRFATALTKLNSAKYSYLKAVEDDSATEKQGVLLKLSSGLYEAMELIDGALGRKTLAGEVEKAKRLKQRAKSHEVGIEDARCSERLLRIATSLCDRLDTIPQKMIDAKRLRDVEGFVSEQGKAEQALSFRRAMGNRYGIFDSLLMKLAGVAEQAVVRNQLMYLNPLYPPLNKKSLTKITLEDIAQAKKEAVEKLKERYTPYFNRVLQIIENCKSKEDVKFLEAVDMKAYEHYVKDLVKAEEEHYTKHMDGAAREPYRGLMIVKMFDAVDNVRTSPMDRKDDIERLFKKVVMIEKAARELEDFYREHGADPEVAGGIRGARLVLINELHGSLIESAQTHVMRRDSIFREGVMLPYLVGQARKLYDKRREYLN